jgi:hypothetical protein
MATQLFGLCFGMDTVAILRDGLGDLMTSGLPCLSLIILDTVVTLRDGLVDPMTVGLPCLP